MVQQHFSINNKSGFHVRPVGHLVKAVQNYKCDTILRYKDREYNAKSILGLLSACVKTGEEVEFICKGPDEQEALKAIEEAIQAGLGESEE